MTDVLTREALRPMTGAAAYDAIVVGAGPAGSATGILLAETGMAVLVLDRATFPRPKMCGEYLSPETARILDRLGVLGDVDRAGAVPLRGMTITGPGRDRVRRERTRRRGAGGEYRDHALALSRATFDGDPRRPAPGVGRGSPGAVPRDRSDRGRRSRGRRGSARPRGPTGALPGPSHDRRRRASLRRRAGASASCRRTPCAGWPS